MFTTLRNAWKIPELRKKMLFTLLVLLIYRLGSCVPVPYVNTDLLVATFQARFGDTVLGLYNAMSGSAFSQATAFALGIQPYINASIIIELLCIAIPSLERLAKDGGEEGKKKIQKITRYTTIGLGLLMGFAYFVMLKNYSLLTQTGFLYGLVIVLTFTAGASFLMWMGERITEKGIGNGVSILIFASIVSSVPNVVINLINGTFHIIPTTNGLAYKWWYGIVVILVVLILTVGIVTVEKAVRRIPVQYAKRVVGRKLYGGQSTHIPLKANANGVMPLIFAMTILQVPGMIGQFWPKGKFNTFVSTYLSPATTNIAGIIIYYVLYAIMIVGFAYFYSSITFNPVEISKNLQQNGGFIPGIRPGRPTSDYLQKKCSRLTMFGALFLMIIAIIPTLLLKVLNITVLSAFGPTSILIMISVSIEIADQLDSLMIMRNHKGFLN